MQVSIWWRISKFCYCFDSPCFHVPCRLFGVSNAILDSSNVEETTFGSTKKETWKLCRADKEFTLGTFPATLASATWKNSSRAMADFVKLSWKTATVSWSSTTTGKYFTSYQIHSKMPMYPPQEFPEEKIKSFKISGRFAVAKKPAERSSGLSLWSIEIDMSGRYRWSDPLRGGRLRSTSLSRGSKSGNFTGHYFEAPIRWFWRFVLYKDRYQASRCWGRDYLGVFRLGFHGAATAIVLEFGVKFASVLTHR